MDRVLGEQSLTFGKLDLTKQSSAQDRSRDFMQEGVQMEDSSGRYCRWLGDKYPTERYVSIPKEEIVRLFGLLEAGVITNEEFTEMTAEQICSAIAWAESGRSE